MKGQMQRLGLALIGVEVRHLRCGLLPMGAMVFHQDVRARLGL